ncbi:MAG: hypothetical protein ACYSUC_05705 [Planctomycetota bacterium]|jgi:hypothetical protein
MKQKKGEKWLDELISRTINSGEPQFDGAGWKEKYSEAYEVLKSRALQSSSPWRNVLGLIAKGRIARFAATSVLVIAVGFLIVHWRPDKQTDISQTLYAAELPAELTTLGSLSFAYLQGGMEMVEQMCDKALKMAGQRPANISLQEFFEETNNGKTERTEL